MAGESASVDIFGNELKLTGSERALVRGKDTVCLRKEVFVEGKKEQEPRVIIVTNAICHVLVTVKGVLKVETSFHFLKIQRIESAGEKAISFQIAGEKFPREYKAKNDNDLLDIVSTIAGQLRNTLPLTPYQELIPLSLQPPSRQKKIDVDSLRLKDNMTSPDVHSVDGFVTVYAFLCELHGVPFREDVAWNISEIYLSHGFRVLKLNDFEQQNQKQLLPLVSSLEHNEYFEGIEQKENELSPDLVNALANVLQNQYRHGFKKLTLNNIGLKRDATLKLVNAVKMNPKSSLTHLDLSENRLDDLCMEALCQMLSGLPHGLSALELNDCAITPRGCVMLASSLKENKHMAVTLSTLNLSGNNFGPDCQGALSFLAEPNAVATLKLARCGIAFEVIFPVLCRGCSQSLAVMDLSDNNKVPKKGKAPTPPVQKIKQFFTTAIAVQTVNMSHCSLTLEVAKAIFEGLRDNPNLSNVSLDISSNELSQGSPKTVAEVLSHLSCIHELNISHNNLNGGVPVIVKALVSSSVKSLTLGGNFGRSKNPMESLTPLCEVLSSKTCSFEILRLTDSKLKENTVPLLEALLSNRSLVELDVSGNDMGDRGARALSRALMVNVKLRSVTWDDNGTTLEGLKSIAEALKYNHTMRSMPAPLRDALKISKDRHKERHLEEVLQEIQSYLYRNHSPERLSVESAARRQRQILLLTAQQQELDRSIVDLDDVVSSVPENARTKVLAEEAKKIREEANKVMTVRTYITACIVLFVLCV
jgi:Ran GTPase-activating protein (RanGAP) involved in mRNA processing and transport